MVLGQPRQLVEVTPVGELIFHREALDEVVKQCGDFPLAIYTVVGEFREGETTLLNKFVAFNHYNEQKQDWKQQKDVQLLGN